MEHLTLSACINHLYFSFYTLFSRKLFCLALHCSITSGPFHFQGSGLVFLPFLPLFTHCGIFPEDNPSQSKGEGINHLNPNLVKNGDSFQKMNNPDTFSMINGINDAVN